MNNGWATPAIEKLRRGETVTLKPSGNSMHPIVKNGERVTVEPLPEDAKLTKNTVVLCTVRGRQYLHQVVSTRPNGDVLVANNRGHLNGWTSRSNVYGRLVR